MEDPQQPEQGQGTVPEDAQASANGPQHGAQAADVAQGHSNSSRQDERPVANMKVKDVEESEYSDVITLNLEDMSSCVKWREHVSQKFVDIDVLHMALPPQERWAAYANSPRNWNPDPQTGLPRNGIQAAVAERIAKKILIKTIKPSLLQELEADGVLKSWQILKKLSPIMNKYIKEDKKATKQRVTDTPHLLDGASKGDRKHLSKYISENVTARRAHDIPIDELEHIEEFINHLGRQDEQEARTVFNAVVSEQIQGLTDEITYHYFFAAYSTIMNKDNNTGVHGYSEVNLTSNGGNNHSGEEKYFGSNSNDDERYGKREQHYGRYDKQEQYNRHQPKTQREVDQRDQLCFRCHMPGHYEQVCDVQLIELPDNSKKPSVNHISFNFGKKPSKINKNDKHYVNMLRLAPPSCKLANALTTRLYPDIPHLEQLPKQQPKLSRRDSGGLLGGVVADMVGVADTVGSSPGFKASWLEVLGPGSSVKSRTIQGDQGYSTTRSGNRGRLHTNETSLVERDQPQISFGRNDTKTGYRGFGRGIGFNRGRGGSARGGGFNRNGDSGRYDQNNNKQHQHTKLNFVYQDYDGASMQTVQNNSVHYFGKSPQRQEDVFGYAIQLD